MDGMSRDELISASEKMNRQRQELSLIVKGLFENIQKEKKERESHQPKDDEGQEKSGFKWEDAAKPITVNVYGYTATAAPRLVVISNNNKKEFANEYTFIVQDANMKHEVCRFYLTADGCLRDSNGDKVASHQDLYMEEFIELFVSMQALDSMLFAVSPNQTAQEEQKGGDATAAKPKSEY